MNSTKFISVFAVIMMVATAGIVVIQFTDGSDADTLGTYDQKINVYYWSNDQWNASTQNSYNLYEAIRDAVGDTGLVAYTATGDNSWKSGDSPNRTYGVITGINSGAIFQIYAYDGSAWQNVTGAPLGWIRPHADYGATVAVPGVAFSASANVAIVLSGQDASTLPTTGLQTLQTVAGNNNTLYYFTIHDDTSSLNFAGYKTVQAFNPATATMGTTTFNAAGIQGTNFVVAAGYGTDAYLALIDALGTNLVSDNIDTTTGKILAWVDHEVFDGGVYQYTYYTYYSWMVSVFGYETEYDEIEQEYLYWGSFSGDYLQYSFGYYSQLNGAYNDQGSAFQLKYVRT